MMSGYDRKSDTGQISSMIYETSNDIQPAYISKEKWSTSHYTEVEFCITKNYPLSPPSTGDIPIEYSDIRPDVNTLDIEVILINIIIVHYQLLVVIMVLPREPNNT